VACAVGPSVTTSSTWFFIQKHGFWNLFAFVVAKITLKSIISHIYSESKSYQTNSFKSWSSRSFQQHQRAHFNNSSQIFSEEIIQYSTTFALQVHTPWNQAHAPLIIKSFAKTPRTRSKTSQFGGSRTYKTKQTSFLLHR
jgi:hypothetical protein